MTMVEKHAENFTSFIDLEEASKALNKSWNFFIIKKLLVRKTTYSCGQPI